MSLAKITLLAVSIMAFSIPASSKDKVVATVNGKKIRKSYFDKVYNQNKLFISDQLVSKEKVLNDLINRELGLQKARKEKTHKNPIVLEKVEDVIYHAQVSKDLEKKLKKLKVSNSEVKNYYRSHKEYRTAHILFRLPINPPQEQTDAALKTALNVYNQLKQKPAKFAEFAGKFSQSENSKTGGDIGYQPSMRLAPEYFSAIDGKTEGYITPPVKTQFGIHVIKLLGVKKYGDISKDVYKKIVYDKKRDAVLAKYFKGLRNGTDIKVNKSLLK